MIWQWGFDDFILFGVVPQKSCILLPHNIMVLPPTIIPVVDQAGQRERVGSNDGDLCVNIGTDQDRDMGDFGLRLECLWFDNGGNWGCV